MQADFFDNCRYNSVIGDNSAHNTVIRYVILVKALLRDCVDGRYFCNKHQTY